MTQAPPRMPKMREETLRKRQEILRAAMATFGSRGYHSGSLNEIAEQVGMTHAGVLHHFGSKDQLLLEVLQYRDAADVAELDGHHIPGGVELFRHLIATAQLNAERRGIVQAYAVLSAESVTDGHPAKQFFQKRYEVLREDVRGAFTELCAQRPESDARQIATASAAILAVMDGLQIQWLLDPTAFELAPATEFAINAIFQAVLHPRPSELTQ